MPLNAAPRRLRVPEGISGLLRDLIHERTGIFFEDSRMNALLEKLEPLALDMGCGSFLDYYYALKDNTHSEWERAWNALSVQETYFYREISQVNALTQFILPAWFKKGARPFRIWSAACATGEEPFSIAIAIAEAGLSAFPIEITASDASPNALAKAAAAVYRENSFRNSFPLALRDKYFTAVAGGWKLSPKITDRVVVKRANLSEPGEIAPLAHAHVVFCRNVFIYFSPHAIRRTVATIATRMPSGGHLFVGASESLLRATTDFELKEVSGALAYVRI
jgi:chemotaxis protein methyltransferase CheR